MAAVLEHASIDDTVKIDDHVFREGKLGGVSVVIGMTGIGLLNATNTTRAMLDRFKVNGVVFSGVAGSTLRIGDVSVPATWSLKDGRTYAAYQPWLDLAETITTPGAVSLENCTVVPASGQAVCLTYEPAIALGGVGQSSDPFGKVPVRCRARGDDVFGCDVTSAGSASVSEADSGAHETVAAADAEAPIVEDMETAAVAREVTARGLPFIGFRSVSDGPGDPLGLPGFPAQFFAYYRLAAHNAAAATAAFLERLAAAA
jgi:nucleoside phosphorylase